MWAKQTYPNEWWSVPQPTVKDLAFYKEIADWNALVSDKASTNDDRIYKLVDASGSPDKIQWSALYAYDATSDTIVLIAEIWDERVFDFTAEPTTGDDVDDWYRKWDVWVYSNSLYICLENASSNAVRKNRLIHPRLSLGSDSAF